MVVRIDKETADYLKELLATSDNGLLSHVMIRKKVKCYIVIVDEDTADEIRDIAMERQTIVGFDNNYHLNKEGVVLERLIDKFYIDTNTSNEKIQ
jgi:hypothetical protein